jgi:predicted metal-dependent phosphoesterase TrpH
MLVDFHCHTCESDGTLAPAQLCGLMNERGVRIFSITDHDSIKAYGQFETPAHMRTVSGIEINTSFNHSEVHVLGYRLPLNESPLTRVLEANRTARRTRVERMVEQLREAGYDITLEHVHAEAAEGASLGRPHVAKALIRRGIAPDIETVFHLFLRRGTPGYVPSTHITPEQAIEVILASGGVPVLAHPGRLKDYSIVERLVEHGLQGIEVFYPTHEPMQVQYFRDQARRFNLVMTGGSDFHDIRYHKRGVGIEVDESDIKPFLDLVA